jgi:hypothetical protein
MASTCSGERCCSAATSLNVLISAGGVVRPAQGTVILPGQRSPNCDCSVVKNP